MVQATTVSASAYAYPSKYTPHEVGQTFETSVQTHVYFQIEAQGAPSGLSFRSASKELETEKIYNRFEDSNMSNM